MFDNTEVDEEAAVSRDMLCHPEAMTEIVKHIGYKHDGDEVFDDIDNDGVGEVSFGCFINWAFNRSLEQRKS